MESRIARPNAFVLLLLLAGCGSEVDIPATTAGELPGISAGARLRPRVALAGDGAAFAGWYDTLLEIHCAFSHAEDGTTRCMPIRWRVGFLDASCTEPVLVTWCGVALDYGDLREYDPSTDPCDPGFSQSDPPARMFRRAGPPVVASAYHRGWVEDEVVVCDPEPTSLDANEVLVPAEQVPAAAFVAVVDTLEPGEGRLSVRWMVGSDGVREAVSAYDVELMSDCRASQLWGEGEACLPLNRAIPQGYADEGCTQPAMSALCGPPAVAMVPKDDCSLEVRARGPEIPAGYASIDGACVAQASTNAQFAVGAVLGPADLPGLVRREVGSGRFRGRYETDVFGLPVRPPGPALFDGEMQTECYPYDVPGLGSVCFPSLTSLPVEERFADPGCTEPVSVVQHDTCSPPGDWILATASEPSCPEWNPSSVRRNDGEIAQIFEQSGPDCLPVTLGEGKRASRLGSTLAP